MISADRRVGDVRRLDALLQKGSVGAIDDEGDDLRLLWLCGDRQPEGLIHFESPRGWRTFEGLEGQAWDREGRLGEVISTH